MGLSGGSKSETGSAQKWAQPIAAGAADMGTGIVNQAQPLTNQLTNSLSSMIPGMSQSFADNQALISGNANYLNGMVGPLTGAAMGTFGNMQGVSDSVNGAMNSALNAYDNPNAATGALPAALQRLYSGDPTLSAAQNYTQGVLGRGMQSNPYLQQMIDATNRDVMNGVNSQFEMGGRYGSDAYAGTLAKQLANNESGLRYQDYTAQQGNLNNAAQLAGSLSGQASANNTANFNNLLNSAQTESGINNQQFGQAMTAAGMQPGLAQGAYAGINPLLATTGAVSDQANASLSSLPSILGAYGSAAALPYTGYTAYTNGLGSIFNGGTQTTSNGIGGILSGVGSIISGFGALKGK